MGVGGGVVGEGVGGGVGIASHRFIVPFVPRRSHFSTAYFPSAHGKHGTQPWSGEVPYPLQGAVMYSPSAHGVQLPGAEHTMPDMPESDDPSHGVEM